MLFELTFSLVTSAIFGFSSLKALRRPTALVFEVATLLSNDAMNTLTLLEQNNKAEEPVLGPFLLWNCLDTQKNLEPLHKIIIILL